MSISSLGLITWLPTEGILNSEEVTIVVTNQDGTAESQVFSITVEPVNDQLQLESIASAQSIDNGSLFSHQILINDIDDENNGENISFELISAPDGLEVSSTGLIEWQPNINQSSEFSIDVAISDGGENATTTVNYSFSLSVLYYHSVIGTTVNYSTGENLSDVNVFITNENGEVASSTTNDTGSFELLILDTLSTDTMTLSTALEGFSEHAVIVNSNELSVSQHVAILPSHVTVSFDPNIANNIEYEEQSIIEFPAQSLAREDGQAIEGQVSAQVTIIDPTSDINLMPGDMVTTLNGELVPIESFGAMNVILTDESGEKINIIDNQQALIRIPVASNSVLAPDEIPLYFFDEEQSIWVEEGIAQKVFINGNEFYQGQVNHFSTWNADQTFETVNINGCVVDNSNTAIENAKIVSQGVDYNGTSSSFTDENGLFSLAVKTFGSVLVNSTQGGQTRTLTLLTGSEDLNLTDCLVLSAATSTVKLTWGENPRDLDAHFYGPLDGTNDGALFHLFYAEQEVLVGNATLYLDNDIVLGFGPEIITIPSFPFEGRYPYLVNRFSGNSDILQSPTRVEVNLESQINIFSPPELIDEVTDVWHVFDFVVGSSGEVVLEEVNEWVDELPLQTTPVLNIQNFQAAKIAIDGSLLKDTIKNKEAKAK